VPEGAEIPCGGYLWKFSYTGGAGNDYSTEILDQVPLSRCRNPKPESRNPK
jgi:hypothetical protein